MSARRKKRRARQPASPHRNYLPDFEPDPDAPNPIENRIEHDRRVSRLRGTVRRLSVRIRRGMKARDWIRLADAIGALRGAEVEIAFNLGFENGFLAGRAESGFAKRSKAVRAEMSLRDSLLRVVAGTPLSAGVTAAVLMELGSALLRRPNEVQP